MIDKKTIYLPGTWKEVLPNGEVLFCYRVRKYGKWITQKLTYKEIERFMFENEFEKSLTEKKLDIGK